MSTLYPTPCPRCGCHVAHEFRCGCGQVHGDFCDNCGLRRCDNVPDSLKKLSAVDVRCERGPVPHAHPPEEHAARVRAYFDELRKLRARISAPGGVA